MSIYLILITSIILQFIAAIISFVIFIRQGKKNAWLAISLAVFLMGVRRSITFYRIISGDSLILPDWPAEIVALTISALMLIGIVSIGDFLSYLWFYKKSMSNISLNYYGLFNNTNDAVFLIDQECNIIDANPQSETLFGYSKHQLLGTSMINYMSPSEKAKVHEDISNLISGNQIPVFECQFIHKDNLILYAEVDISLVLDVSGEILHILSIIRDITTRIQTNLDLIESKRMLYDVLNAIPVRVFWKDLDSVYLGCNQLFAEDAGRGTPEEIIGDNDYRMGWADQAELYRGDDKYVMQSGIPKINYEEPQSTPDGRNIWLNTSKIPLRDSNGEVYGVLGTYEDITERKKVEDKLKHMATHDDLTDLPNRELLNELLNHAINIADRGNQLLAVLFLDLDGFKAVNDAYGHEQGDWLLQLLSTRIRNVLRDSDILARLGGDEFGIILEQFDQPTDILPVVEKIMHVLAEPFNIQESETFITGSLGISIYPTDGYDAKTLLNNADRAMYQAKESGKNIYQFYSEKMETQMLGRLELRNDLRLAILKEQLALYFQPQVDSHSGEVIGVEALVRWQHPTEGLLTPAKFIEHAEDTGLIIPLGQWVMKTAIKQLAHWKKLGISPARMSVNVSRRELQQGDYYKTLPEMFVQFDIAHNQIELEITENTIFSNMEKAAELLNHLKEIGVQIAIDDFGSGYSTLGLLAKFPFDTLKIDKSFASSLSNQADREILKGIVDIGNNLKLNIIGEGIENEEQLKFYQNARCNIIQGFLFSKPIPPGELEVYLRDGYNIPKD